MVSKEEKDLIKYVINDIVIDDVIYTDLLINNIYTVYIGYDTKNSSLIILRKLLMELIIMVILKLLIWDYVQ